MDSTAEGAPRDWAALAGCDLLTAHDIMLANHPGPVDEENPGFLAVADKALAGALELVPRVNTPEAFQNVLAAYSAPFRDGHFGVHGTQALFDLPSSREGGPRWAGVVIGFRDGHLAVAHAEPELGISEGDALIGCDGIDAKELMHRNVFAFATRDPKSPTSWRTEAHRLLRHYGNPFVELPKSCEFETETGRIGMELDWRPFTQEVRWPAERKSLFGPKPAVGMQEIRPGVWWIQLPDFSPTTEEEIYGIKNLIADVAASREELATSKAIVFDTRGNQGGSSVWGRRVLKALYGEEYVDHRTHQPGVEVHWRASEENETYLESLGDRFNETGETELAHFVIEVAVGMRTARETGLEFYVASREDDEAPAPAGPHDVKAKTYLFTHGWCASACLDFADYALAMEGLTHIGHATGSDSYYMEVRQEKLPSGFSRVVVPIKVYRNRMRGNGDYYTPEFGFDEFDWTDESVREWFLEEVYSRAH
ncbi:hypothetical protein ABI59_15185 [Acidobacteria bacterium Mor1]|nr:hypothetical protein ABI59_15185 [Acidobacteria bacterium Mor1]